MAKKANVMTTFKTKQSPSMWDSVELIPTADVSEFAHVPDKKTPACMCTGTCDPVSSAPHVVHLSPLFVEGGYGNRSLELGCTASVSPSPFHRRSASLSYILYLTLNNVCDFARRFRVIHFLFCNA